ncbi:hypothetical protein OAY_12380 [Vibrio cyclitrophicus ZF205]|nr:hypothetical protein OAY_12380 [Vibrio cyclitrophicus ZF205]
MSVTDHYGIRYGVNRFICRLLVRMMKQAGKLLFDIILYEKQYATKVITICNYRAIALFWVKQRGEFMKCQP